MDLGSTGDMQQCFGGINFPARKEEGASGAESNGAPQQFVDRIRKRGHGTFNGPQEVLRAVQGS